MRPLVQIVLEKLNALAEIVTHLSAESRELQGRLNQLKASLELIAELEEQRWVNAYLMGELQRRRSEPSGSPASGRIWWHFWKRR